MMEVSVKVDYPYIRKVMKSVERLQLLLLILNFMTMGIFRKRINYQVEKATGLLTQAVEESIKISHK